MGKILHKNEMEDINITVFRISYFNEEVLELNQQYNTSKSIKKTKQLSDDSSEKHTSYFPMKNINGKLSVKNYIALIQTTAHFCFNVFGTISALFTQGLSSHVQNQKSMTK